LRGAFCLNYLKLRFNPSTNKYSNRAGVKVIVKGFGKTDTVECLAKGFLACSLKAVQYMKAIVKYFVKRGYRRNVDIRAAPYDWRLDPGNLRKTGFFQKVKKLIEQMYNGQGVTIIGHSLGGVSSLYFLNEIVSPQWKKKYIKAFIPVGTPFGGALKALGAILFGSPPGSIDVTKLPKFVLKYLQGVASTLPSVISLTPRADVFGNKILVKTSRKSYTAHNYRRFYNAIKYPIGWKMYQPTLAINAGYRNPGVPTYCIYGTGKKTAEQYVYKRHPPRGLPRIINGNGDGTVNQVSLQVCHRWTTKVFKFRGLDHLSIMKSDRSLKRMYAIANA
jgi:lysophospholipase-3